MGNVRRKGKGRDGKNATGSCLREATAGQVDRRLAASYSKFRSWRLGRCQNEWDFALASIRATCPNRIFPLQQTLFATAFVIQSLFFFRSWTYEGSPTTSQAR